MRRAMMTLMPALCLMAASPTVEAGPVSATLSGWLNPLATNGVIGWGSLFGIDDREPGFQPFSLTYSYDLDLAGSRSLATAPGSMRTESFLFPGVPDTTAVSIALTIAGHALTRSVTAASGPGMVTADMTGPGTTLFSVATGNGAAATIDAWLSFRAGLPRDLDVGSTLYDALSNATPEISLILSGSVYLTGTVTGVFPISSSAPQPIPAPASAPILAAGIAAVALLRRKRRDVPHAGTSC